MALSPSAAIHSGYDAASRRRQSSKAHLFVGAITATLLALAVSPISLSEAEAQSTTSLQTPAATQQAMLAGFTPEVVKSALAIGLPGEWQLSSFTEQAAINTGTLVEPVVRTRFEATVSLSADTYTVDGNDGPIVFVRKVAPAGLQKILYGLSTSTLQAGSWPTQLDIQNPDVLQGVGSSLATIPGQLIIRGSPQEAAYEEQRDAEAAHAVQEKLTAHKLAVQLAAQQAAEDASLAATKEKAAGVEAAAQQQAATATAIAQAQQQTALAAIKADAQRQQAQLDAAAGVKLAQTQQAADEARQAQDKALLAVQQQSLQDRTALLENLRLALQSQSRSERLAALDTALAGNDLALSSLAFDSAFGSHDPAAENVALRAYFAQKKSIIFNIFQPTAWKQNEQAPLGIVDAFGGVRLEITQFDVKSGSFVGDLFFGSGLQWQASGSIDGDTMSLAARGPGKPVSVYGSPISLAFTLELSPAKEMDGFAQLGGSTFGTQLYSPVIVRVDLD